MRVNELLPGVSQGSSTPDQVAVGCLALRRVMKSTHDRIESTTGLGDSPSAPTNTRWIEKRRFFQGIQLANIDHMPNIRATMVVGHRGCLALP